MEKLLTLGRLRTLTSAKKQGFLCVHSKHIANDIPVLSSTCPVDVRVKLSRPLAPNCTKHVDDKPENVIHPTCMDIMEILYCLLEFLATFHTIELEINTVVCYKSKQF